MEQGAVERPIEREYRSVISDNREERASPFAPATSSCARRRSVAPRGCRRSSRSCSIPTGEAVGRVGGRSVGRRPLGADRQLVARSMLRASPFLKTHTPADGIPWYPAASYIVVGRDGRDAFMSFLNHMRNLQPDLVMSLAMTAADDGIDLYAAGPPPVEDVHEFFAWCMEDNPMWFEHVASFWEHRREPNVLFVHYNDMQGDLDARDAESCRVSRRTDVDEQQWQDRWNAARSHR